MSGSELVSIELEIMTWTDKAVLTRIDKGGKKVWLPFSQIETGGALVKGEKHEVTLPEWLAQKFEEDE